VTIGGTGEGLQRSAGVASSFVAVTNVYVDGFNLYHGLKEVVKRGTAPGTAAPSWRWLDLHAIAARIAPRDQIHRVRYFTARVTAPDHDPQLRQRQQTYIRALSTLPSISVHYGQFTVQTKRMPLAQPVSKKRHRGLTALGLDLKRHADGNCSVSVLRTEEKGSDVNLATYLVVDAFRKDFEKAVVVSNDTDLCEPIRIVARELGLPVVVVNPRGYGQPAAALQKVASETRLLRIAAVEQSQFAETLTDERGTITRPAGW
jgi:uncharacterized LabA/DUF88 family protein